MNDYKKIILIIAVVLLFFSTLVVPLNKNEATVYPKFSLSEFESQREFIREYFSDEIEEINKSSTLVNSIDFAIAVMDINDDQVKDILVVILHPYFSGYQNNGLFAVFTSDEEEMKYVPLTQITVDSNNLEMQEQIRVIKGGEDIMDIEINGDLWKWIGDKYTLEANDM